MRSSGGGEVEDGMQRETMHERHAMAQELRATQVRTMARTTHSASVAPAMGGASHGVDGSNLRRASEGNQSNRNPPP